MGGQQFRLERRYGSKLFAFVPKPRDKFAFLAQVMELTQAGPAELANATLARKQFYESLKNAFVHGGDALVGVRRYPAFKRGESSSVLEVVVWDNGKGIWDLGQALKYEWSSTGKMLGGFSGYGLGLDYADGMVFAPAHGRRVPFHAADEILIESGRQIALRRHKTDAHLIWNRAKNVPGTKITSKFWRPA